MKSEGGYVNNPHDPGGETNHGVTIGSWSNWLRRPIKPGEMAKLTLEDVKPFYKEIYWKQCQNLPTGLDYAVFDACINMGSGRAIKLLQESLGCVADGVIGPNVLQAIHNSNIDHLLDKFNEEKESFYKSLSNFAIFGRGWINRCNEVLKNAKEMLHG